MWWHPLSGADGIALKDGKLFLAFDAAAFVITPGSEGWLHAEVESLEDMDTHGGVTAFMVADGRLFATNGQAPRFVLGRSPDPAAIWEVAH